MDKNDFKKTYLFSSLTNSELELLIGSGSGIHFSKGEVIYKQGTFVNGAYYLLSGFARIYYESERKNSTLKIVRPQWFVGLLSVFSHETHLFSAIAINKCDILHLKKETLDLLMMQNPEFSFRMTHVISLLATDLAKYLVLQNQKNVRGRISDILLYLAETIYQDNSFEFVFTRKDVGEMANTTTETAIRILNEFIRDRLISLVGKKMTLLEPGQLRRISEVS